MKAIAHIKRASSFALTLLIVSIMTFGAFTVVKGDSALMEMGTQSTEEKAAVRRAALGTDKSLASQYASWINGLLHGDMGVSFRYKQSVTSLIMQALPVTLAIGTLSLFLALFLGIPLGALSAMCRPPARAVIGTATVVCLSIPEFFLSVIVICVFSLTLHLFVPGERGASSVFFPALVIAMPLSALLTKFVSAAVTAERGRLYVRTARCMGEREIAILVRHIMPNALVALLPLASMMAASVFTGSVITEEVFGISGIGRLLVGAVLYRDLPLCRALVLCIAFFTASLNFAVDEAAGAMDKRVSLA